MDRRRKVRAPLYIVCRETSVTSPVPLSLHSQIYLNVVRTDRSQSNPATCDVLKEMAAISRVLLDGPPAEIAFSHVFAQSGQPLINPRLFGNVFVSGGRQFIG